VDKAVNNWRACRRNAYSEHTLGTMLNF